MNKLSCSSIRIISIIRYFPNGCDKKIIKNILNIEDMEKDVAELRLHKYIFMPHEDIIILNNDIDVFREYNIVDCIKEDDTPIIKLLYYYYDNKYKNFLDDALLIFEFFLGKDLNQAFAVAELLSNIFSKIHLDINNKNLCLAYLEKSYQILTLIESYSWKLPRLFVWTIKGEALAFAINNKEYIAIFNFFKSLLALYNVARRQKNFWLDSLKKGLSVAENCKNTKLSIISSYYKTILYYFEGDFSNSISVCYTISSDISDKFLIILLRNVYLYGIFSAIAVNEYIIAFDICDKAINVYGGNNIKYIEKHFRVIKIYIHILNGERKIASGLLDDIINSYGQDDITNGFLWALRIKAYIYYLEGDIQASYRFYRAKIHIKLMKQYFHTGYMCSYFMLNILSEYYKHGLPNLYPYSIIDEIPVAKQSPSIIVRGVAHRISGQLKMQLGSFYNEEVEHELLEAYTIFKSKNVPQELGICCIELARVYYRTDRLDKAIQVLKEADEIYQKYGSPVLPDDLIVLLNDSEKEVDESTIAESFIYASPQMADVEASVKMMALHNTPVLILGESGVGKENIARQLHQYSGRTGKFVTVNLNSIPDELFESELFGHEKGAYTGATGKKAGLFDMADGGTLFLDEIGDISLRFQVKLLRVIQEHEFLPIGSTSVHTSDFRLVCATNRDLQSLMLKGDFREDLYFRINVLTLKIPPLRERGTDILKIANHYLNIYCAMYSIQRKFFSHEIINFMMSYSWPGNIRELKNYVERYVLTNKAITINSTDSSPDKSSDFFDHEIVIQNENNNYANNEIQNNIFFNFNNNILKSFNLEKIKIQYIEWAWIQCNGMVDGPDGMAKLLGISKVSVYKYINMLNLREKYPVRVFVKK